MMRNSRFLLKKRIVTRGYKAKKYTQSGTYNRDSKQKAHHKNPKPKTQPQDLSCACKITNMISKRLILGASGKNDVDAVETITKRVNPVEKTIR
jgi:hypothetical protein